MICSIPPVKKGGRSYLCYISFLQAPQVRTMAVDKIQHNVYSKSRIWPRQVDVCHQIILLPYTIIPLHASLYYFTTKQMHEYCLGE